MDYTEVDHALVMGMAYGVLAGVFAGVALALFAKSLFGPKNEGDQPCPRCDAGGASGVPCAAGRRR